MSHWPHLSYLEHGTARQRQAVAAITRLGIWTTLQAYAPVLAGTIPLAVDLPASDLDVICEVPEPALPACEQLLRRHYAHRPDFRLTHRVFQDLPTIVCGFRAEGFAWEVFGQPQPTARQQAVRHLAVEQAILEAGGEAWRRAVRQLKHSGLKTEPAFAQLLRLPGDPYAALLTLEGLTPAQLRPRLAGLLPAG
ncbi:DUF4269 domain-containing protein [Hymenobacter sp. BT635]|uniref:DUF4269 domain-containing protein n=1 Tax=Hymenobacter nitidus TaxID=2880929 RepID=A0ABS8AE51_9BACT|nr:DUF4269 domain-containing protein [Hymenobacter nitidus]MCB2378556.1 DUF4269 domain-containing protein [Hymenobacter nitidus]